MKIAFPDTEWGTIFFYCVWFPYAFIGLFVFAIVSDLTGNDNIFFAHVIMSFYMLIVSFVIGVED